MTVLWVKGFADDRKVDAKVDDQGRILIGTAGSINMFDVVGHPSGDKSVVFPGTIRLEERPALIVNEISNPETHRIALQATEKLVENAGCAVLNEPSRVMKTTREMVSSLLRDKPELLVPKTLLITPRSPDDVIVEAGKNGIGYPFIIREANTHGGSTVLLIRDDSEHAKMHALRFDGRGMHLIEFIDYRDPDGLYRKYRFVMVDGEPFLRHVLISPQWMVHASAAQQMAKMNGWLEEEQIALQTFDEGLKPQTLPAMRAIDEALELDYWGVDCNLRPDGRMLVFEANCNMNITPNTRPNKATTQPYIDKITDAFARMVKSRKNRAAG